MINYIRGIKKSYDYARIRGADNEDEYQAAMVIINESVPGKSFWITRDALWKYLDPMDNREDKTVTADRLEFQKIIDRHVFAARTAVTPMQHQACSVEASRIMFALALNKTDRIMLCTGYNLAICMQIFNIVPCPAAAAQLLLWIQDGLDHLKDMPDDPPAPDSKITMGEVTIFNGSTKLTTRDISVPESELIMDSEG